MGDLAVKVQGLGKIYRIGGHEETYETLRENIARAFSAPFRNLRSRFRRLSGVTTGKDSRTFWALRDISFDLEHGDVLGVIGRNGAGKSTLLKILCRVTEPSEGRIELRGRVGSLLEVGTGFHPELSGRENIYLNGAVLGMARKEIDRKFDDIVSFAETEEFLDTQVKHYSSGMYMRLAFAVAAHMEPEILLVDEVLAVGDAAFQKKCLGKMGTIAREGRTVLFVSHNMGAINSLCNRAMWIDAGRITQIGRTDEVTEAYTLGLRTGDEEGRIGYTINTGALAKHKLEGLQILDCRLINPESPMLGARTGDPLRIEIDYSSSQRFMSPAFSVSVRDLYGYEILRLNTMPFSGFEIESLHQRGQIHLKLNSLPLVGGHYLVDVHFERPGISRLISLDQVLEFDVEPSDPYKSGKLLDRRHGLMVVEHNWNHFPLPRASAEPPVDSRAIDESL